MPTLGKSAGVNLSIAAPALFVTFEYGTERIRNFPIFQNRIIAGCSTGVLHWVTSAVNVAMPRSGQVLFFARSLRSQFEL